MIEAGDVDWANHDDNVDNSIGAVCSGDDAFRAVTQWAERNGCWDETVIIVTADHGHLLVLDEPEAIAAAGRGSRTSAQDEPIAPLRGRAVAAVLFAER